MNWHCVVCGRYVRRGQPWTRHLTRQYHIANLERFIKWPANQWLVEYLKPQCEQPCPCVKAYDKAICSPCWEECRMDDSHFKGCEVAGCLGSGTLSPPNLPRREY